MGIDILPGCSPRSSRTPIYSVVILRDGNVLTGFEAVPLPTVIRLIIEYHVDILAVDNIYEIAEDSRDLARISRLIPYWCKIVEVTNLGDKYISVEELAHDLGIKYNHLTPETTALVNAYAAYKGYGREVKAPSDRTYIIVSKGRTPIQGGSSSTRYKRSIRASILQLVRGIREILDDNHVDYDLVVKESDGGLERGFFVVYAPVEKVRDLIKPIKYKNVRVVVKPAIASKPLREYRKNVILGIDPGTSVGIAVLDLDGTPLLIYSYKNPDRESIIEAVLTIGKPIIVAVDVNKPPEYAKKIATMLNAVLFTPEEDLSIEEKQKLVREYESLHHIDISDAHSRDALAAALKAFGHIKPVLDEVESKIRGILGVNRDEVVAEVIRGKPISEVLESLFMKTLSHGKKIIAEDQITRRDQGVQGEEILRLKARIGELENTIRRLEETLNDKEEILKNLELEVKLLRKRSLSEECDRKISQMQLELDMLKRSLYEKSCLVDTLRKKIADLEKILLETALGKNTLVCKKPMSEDCRGLPVFVSDVREINEFVEYVRKHRTGVVSPRGLQLPSWKDLRIPIIEADVLVEFGDYLLVAGDLKREIDSMWQIIDNIEEQEKRDRILRMIKEYQDSRKNLLNRE